ncbi:RNB domain-containing ribonuclease [Rhizorhabdus dicambivorans]|uniref:RNB domain-containing ribonuclease n=1 Tax=Rhizorhabdus dicambivorans TaxID=1850238 RepID=A0A2A4G0U4_9SPHN|nr:RNB domain-containing ribonuclease [Rhizorhabdus dicambivorans]ATE64835.1 RNB domain-containing ribonuclease [Rhizorhabdus dicambivorans]PCE44109.1 RNB domain-containing ribonuclease [Rhizorhabdus dicambivorans]
MKVIADPGKALARGLGAIREEFQVPPGFPPEVIAAAETAARRVPDQHADRTDRPFVTLDPASSTDLDQAFAIEPAGADLLLHYAIADVGWFVADGDPLDREAWRRGETLYLPDGKAGLYPPQLSEGAASLLPDGPRPAVVFTVRIDPAGLATLDGAERAIIRSRAKLAYDNVTPDQLPPDFVELARRAQAAEAARGAVRVDPPEQEVVLLPGDGFDLAFRPRLKSEADNAALSLATNLAVAAALHAHRTGLFRVMAEPDERAVAKLRLTAGALGIGWPPEMTLEQLERRLDPTRPAEARFMLAIRRAGPGAAYMPWRDGTLPWHAAVAAPYAHATAPLRRLADRYVVRAALEIANGHPVPLAVGEAFEKLPAVMARADTLAGRIERAVVDLAEAVLLSERIGQTFHAVATEADGKGAKVQLCDMAVVARVTGSGIEPGAALQLRLTAVDVVRRTVAFERV